MIPVVTPTQMAAIDAAATEPVGVLIERAGRAVARAALRMLGGGYGRRVVVLHGPGNNGADGLAAAARLVDRGVRVRTFPVVDAPEVLDPADLYVDAAFGTGLSRPHLPPRRGAPDAPVLAVDIPSGIDGLTGETLGSPWRADHTVTFAAMKPGLLFGAGRAASGSVEVADIGLDPTVAPSCGVMTDAGAAMTTRGAHDRFGGPWHKWQRAVLVVAGSREMTGAAALTCGAALRSGAGYVHLVGPMVPVTGLAVEVVRSDTPATVDPRRFAAAAVGPGLGRGDEASERLAWALELPLPLVIDADALTILGHDVSRRLDARPGPTVLTPHDGEYRALTGESPGADRIAAARDLAAVTGAVVLLKGGPTVVAAPDGRTRIVVSGDRRLAAAGTGDVLTGAICGQLAWQGSPPGPIHEVVAAAAHVHGRAAASGPDRGFVASDLLDLLAGAWC